MSPQQNFIQSFNELSELAYQNAREKGFWDDRNDLVMVAGEYDPKLGEFAEKCVRSMNIALVHSEISEGLEGLRKNLQDDKIPEFTMEEAEYADAIIRIMDMSAARELRVAEALVAKMEMNRGREFRHGNKAF